MQDLIHSITSMPGTIATAGISIVTIITLIAVFKRTVKDLIEAITVVQDVFNKYAVQFNAEDKTKITKEVNDVIQDIEEILRKIRLNKLADNLHRMELK